MSIKPKPYHSLKALLPGFIAILLMSPVFPLDCLVSPNVASADQRIRRFGKEQVADPSELFMRLSAMEAQQLLRNQPKEFQDKLADMQKGMMERAMKEMSPDEIDKIKKIARDIQRDQGVPKSLDGAQKWLKQFENEVRKQPELADKVQKSLGENKALLNTISELNRNSKSGRNPRANSRRSNSNNGFNNRSNQTNPSQTDPFRTPNNTNRNNRNSSNSNSNNRRTNSNTKSNNKGTGPSSTQNNKSPTTNSNSTTNKRPSSSSKRFAEAVRKSNASKQNKSGSSRPKESVGNRFDRMILEAAKNIKESRDKDSTTSSGLSKSLGSIFEKAVNQAHEQTKASGPGFARSLRKSLANMRSTGNRQNSRFKNFTNSVSAAGRPFENVSQNSFNPWWLLLILLVPPAIYFMIKWFPHQSMNEEVQKRRRRKRVMRLLDIRKPGDLVRALDYFVLSSFGGAADSWNSRQTQSQLCLEFPSMKPGIKNLIRNYEWVRYSEKGSGTLSDESLISSRQTLSKLVREKKSRVERTKN